MNKYQILNRFWYLYDNFGIKEAIEFLQTQNYKMDECDNLDNLFYLLEIQ